MCAGPVDNLIEDITGVTAKKNAAKQAAEQAAAQQAANDAAAEAEAIRLAELEAKKQAIIDAAAAEEANISNTLGDELADIQQTNTDLTNQIIDKAITTAQPAPSGPSGPSASELAAQGAAQTSQSVLQNEKKKKKGALKIPYSPSKRKEGDRGPKSTKADLQIEGQTQATGTGTNLAI